MISRETSCRHPGVAPSVLLALLALISSNSASSAKTPSEPAADAAGAQDPLRWNLRDLYATPEAWGAASTDVRTTIEGLERYRGTLGKSAADAVAALDAIFSVKKELRRLYMYASLKGDEDLRSAPDQARRLQARSLATLFAERTAWLAPEIVELGEAKVRALEEASPDLKRRFGLYLHDTLRAKPHTLGPQAEHVLAAAQSLLAQPSAINDQLTEADAPYPQLRVSGGKTLRLDEPAYEKYRQSKNRVERKKVFDAFWAHWREHEGSAGANLTLQVMGDEFTAGQRHFGTALEASLFESNMPEAVYRTLVEQVHAGLPTLHRYLRMRRQRLGITGQLAYYDNYPSMFELQKPPHFSVLDSEKITLEALAPMGPEYLAILREGFQGRWMDALPRAGKVSGGYMAGNAYDVHPYLLLNHNDDYASLTVFAHEWGHAVHTQLANAQQTFENADYSSFIAESASIGNEMLLNDYLVAHASSKAEKLYYLGEGLELIRLSFFRQTLFAEFEESIHTALEKGEALSGARMTEMYCALMKRYYGESQGVMKIDPSYCIEWAYVPHFYMHFYVWQYATSIAGAAAFTDAILAEGADARERFLTMLRAGGSDYPYDLYKRAGIDMAKPEPYRAIIVRMNRLLDEIDGLMGRQ